MKIAALLVLALLLGAALGFAQATEPAPYPDGTFCTPVGDLVHGTQTRDHPCACKNMADPATSCETRTTNDPACKQYCSEAHCACPAVCSRGH